ncbi:MAG TPA: hypothetical protein VE866_04295 [Candidatus Binatia bacterium]|jgi:hypothetical protein|nr:hypothetical protein [Candidatus Binatia bacterium]
MTIQKKSLLNSLNTTKKAIVASNSAEEKPNVAAPVSARLNARLTAKVGARLAARVAAQVNSRVKQ